MVLIISHNPITDSEVRSMRRVSLSVPPGISTARAIIAADRRPPRNSLTSQPYIGQQHAPLDELMPRQKDRMQSDGRQRANIGRLP